MTGYEEILTDPSYAGQIITFTFPHIGNVGTNEEDIETVNMAATPGARGVILQSTITAPSNYRATRSLNDWLKARGIIGLCGIDTRALTALIRGEGHAQCRDRARGRRQVRSRGAEKRSRGLARPGRHGPGADGDLGPAVFLGRDAVGLGQGFGRQSNPDFHVVAVDYGIKRNILRLLAGSGCKVTVVPAKTSAEDIMALKPDGVFLSNGPGDPAATGEYAVPVIKKLIDSARRLSASVSAIRCSASRVGGKTMKMHQGHHGANHPVKDLTTGKVEITSMNHGFAVDKETLPKNVEQTHVSLFDGSNCGIALKDKPVFSVQYHPEASPGPARQPLSVHALRRHDAAGQRRQKAQDRVSVASCIDTHRVTIYRNRMIRSFRHRGLRLLHERGDESQNPRSVSKQDRAYSRLFEHGADAARYGLSGFATAPADRKFERFLERFRIR